MKWGNPGLCDVMLFNYLVSLITFDEKDKVEVWADSELRTGQARTTENKAGVFCSWYGIVIECLVVLSGDMQLPVPTTDKPL
jgi:hypothetical protein